jgi:hypothetical protein
LRLIVDNWVEQGFEKPFHYPKTHDEAIQLRNDMPIPQHQLATTTQPLTQMLWDPDFIQSLGQDETTFDNEEIIHTTAADSDSNSDSSSDAVNLTQHSPQIVVQNHLAVATQIQQRLHYDLHRLLPSLHGLANLLTDASTQNMSPELEELLDLLSSMRVSVDHIMTQSATEASPEPLISSNLPQAAVLGIYHPRKRSRHPFLLPPSPECRQKRKESYAPL